MMQEEVCVVLNEREPTKAKMAATLLAHLKEQNITASRIDIGKNVERIIKERCPKIIVLDYLLGDVTTGLDLIQGLSKLGAERPQVIFLTDEPSIQVAVSAMRAGAVNYIQIDNPNALSATLADIHSILRSSKQTQESTRRKRKPITLDDLVAQSKSSSALIQRCRTIAHSSSPITIIHGPAGSGRSILAEALFQERGVDSHYQHIDLDLNDLALESITGLGRKGSLLKLGSTLSLTIDHADADDGELINFIDKSRLQIWTEEPNQSFLTIASSVNETIQAWHRLFPDAALITIPALSERGEDISALAQRFLREAHEGSHLKIKPFEPDLMLWLSKQSWPGDIAELRAVVFESSIQHALNATDPKQTLGECKERWEREHELRRADQLPDPLLASLMLEQYGHRYRLAAAALGTTVQRLHKLISGAVS